MFPSPHIQQGLSPHGRQTQANSQQLQNINCISIAIPNLVTLRLRLTLGWISLPRKPWIFGQTLSHSFLRYLCLHPHFNSLQTWFLSFFIAKRTLFYQYGKPYSTNSVLPLIANYFRRRTSRWVSYYALFKWWLLLSQHPHCHWSSTSFPLKVILAPYLVGWAVSLSTTKLIPRSLTARPNKWYSEFDRVW